MERGSPESFTRMGTLGIEEECFVVDERGRPASATDELVYETEPPEALEGKLDHELFTFVIETQTPVIDHPSNAREALLSVREALVSHAAAHGYGIAAAGLHPLANWRELEHADKPRYRAQLDRIRYPQHRNTTAGVHVHVGVDDADKAVWIANELRWYVPIILALSANSPYWCGFDTGLESARAKIFEALPNTGMPTAFADYEAFDAFERRMVETGSISDRGELWYDVRPHSSHGTVEIRTPDGQADPEVVLAFVEYAHALVCALADDYDDGVSPTDHRRELLDENKWRALRYGHEASFIARDLEGTVTLAEVVERECDRLGVDGIRRVFETDSGSTRQRRLRREEGDDALCASLALETS
ncbi:glutamate--cysteine ligase [Natronobiforma cellulositropha]|uniref:glutamate--cysteine ligase n=1 Tax=Natronobiforma cellulositropha TaxID=1679076 RepID=UPI0021D5815E|nr:glutamate--cysteine ligase [Natronobiforma cellulositropha]